MEKPFNKRSFEHEFMTIKPTILCDQEAHERACEERAIRMGIMTDKTYQIVENLEPSKDDHVWLFVPSRTSKRSIQNMADTCSSRLVRFFVRMRCLTKYIYSDRFDVAYHLNDEGHYYILPDGVIHELHVRVITPEQNPGVLEFVRAQTVVAHVPTATHGA